MLVHGAAGGVGSFAVELARWKGAHVIGTSSANNLEFVRSLGAESAIDYNATPFEKVVNGMDVVIDTVGGDFPKRSYKVLRPNGIFVTVATQLPEDAGKAEGIKAMAGRRAPIELLREISELLESKKINPEVGRIFPLIDGRKAQELSETGHGRGRIVLQIR